MTTHYTDHGKNYSKGIQLQVISTIKKNHMTYQCIKELSMKLRVSHIEVIISF